MEEKKKKKNKKRNGEKGEEERVLGFCFLNEWQKLSMKMEGPNGLCEKWV